MGKKFTTVRVSDINKNWLELERMEAKVPTLDEALTRLRKKTKNKDYVFHL